MNSVFISHSSANKSIAMRLESELRNSGFTPWLDTSNMKVGVLLSPQLLDSISESNCVILLWSKDAEQSRWVNMEWLLAFHSKRFVIPFVVDGTVLPRCMQKSLFVDLDRGWNQAMREIEEIIRNPPSQGTPIAPFIRGRIPQPVNEVIEKVYEESNRYFEALGRGDITTAKSALDSRSMVLHQIPEEWSEHPWILLYKGYYFKDVYQLNHWQEIQAGMCPEDPLLDKAEAVFIRLLCADPTDDGALNGLGNILTFKRDLDAAERFISWAIDYGRLRSQDIAPYENDLNIVKHYRVVPLFETLRKIDSAEALLEGFQQRIDEAKMQNRISDANTFTEVRDTFKNAIRLFRETEALYNKAHP